MHVPMLALQREYAAVEPRLAPLWQESFASMRLLKGSHLEAFETEIAAFTGAAFAVGVASGTDALALALIAVGVGPGDEVLLQANGFTADVEAIRIAGARPVLVDVAPTGYGPDPEALERAVTPRTRAVLVVHLYGEPVEMEPIRALCRRRGLRLVEDGSHAHGARLEGRHAGTLGDAGAFSAGIIKNLGAYGDAGFVSSPTTRTCSASCGSCKPTVKPKRITMSAMASTAASTSCRLPCSAPSCRCWKGATRGGAHTPPTTLASCDLFASRCPKTIRGASPPSTSMWCRWKTGTLCRLH